jgi:hypothetical protein
MGRHSYRLVLHLYIAGRLDYGRAGFGDDS